MVHQGNPGAPGVDQGTSGSSRIHLDEAGVDGTSGVLQVHSVSAQGNPTTGAITGVDEVDF